MFNYRLIAQISCNEVTYEASILRTFGHYSNFSGNILNYFSLIQTVRSLDEILLQPLSFCKIV